MAIIDLKEYIHRQRKLNKRSMFQGNQSKRLKAKNEHMWKILMKYGEEVGMYDFNISGNQYINFLTYTHSDPLTPMQQQWLESFSLSPISDKDKE